VSEKDAATATVTSKSAAVEDTASVPWTDPVTPTFESKFVFEANIQRLGTDYELWHNPVTGEYDLRPIGGN
jgi:hypothetical protein